MQKKKKKKYNIKKQQFFQQTQITKRYQNIRHVLTNKMQTQT